MITLEKFKEVLTYLQKYKDKGNKVEEIINTISADFPPLSLFGLAEGHTTLILDLLKYIFQDEGDWLSYWLYELDCGKNYTPDSITEMDGTPILLESIEDLYEFLIKEKKSKQPKMRNFLKVLTVSDFVKNGKASNCVQLGCFSFELSANKVKNETPTTWKATVRYLNEFVTSFESADLEIEEAIDFFNNFLQDTYNHITEEVIDD